MTEVTVILKDSEGSYKHDFIIYETYTVAMDDPLILQCIDHARKSFDREPETVQVKIHMEF